MDLLSHYLEVTPKAQQAKSTIAVLASLDHIAEQTPHIANSIIQELNDQRKFLKMIASENYCSLAVQLAMGNWLTDKYAEGSAHHRFYAGCDNIDTIEDYACNSLKKLFQAEHAYVQPHSGADANLIAFWAILTTRVQSKEVERLHKKSIDEFSKEEFEALRSLLLSQKMLGLSLNSGGHLTHGYRHNISSKIFNTCFYEVNATTGLLDYEAIRKQALAERPAILLAGFSAYPRKINFAIMRQIADESGATLMVDMAHFSGLVAGKVFTGEFNPIPYADVVTSTTHKTLRGPRGGIVMCKEPFKEALDKGCPLVQGGPLPHVMAAKAIAFEEALQPSFATYADTIVANAQSLAEHLSKASLRVLTGGTDNHMVLVDVSPLGLTGRQAELALRQCGITANRNAIPFDANGPWYTSGIRLGTPALTTLGMQPDQMKDIAAIIVSCLKNTAPVSTENGMSKALFQTSPAVIQQATDVVGALLEKYPLYSHIVLPKDA